MGKVRRGLKMPCLAALDNFYAAALLMCRKLREGRRYIHAIPDIAADLLDSHGLVTGKQGRFNRAHIGIGFNHVAFFLNINGAKVDS
jgi:hypothetical protein